MSRLNKAEIINRKYIFSKVGLNRSAGPSTTEADIKQCNPLAAMERV